MRWKKPDAGLIGSQIKDMIQLYLDLDLEPSQNHQAKLMADNFCDHEGWSNWDAAYEFSWEIIEGGLQNCQPITK